MRRLILAAALALSACAPLQQRLGHELTSQTSAQVATLADAEQAATVATRAADLWVVNARPSRSHLIKLRQLNEAVHTALQMLEQDRLAGKSLAFGGYNAALQALTAFTAAGSGAK